MLRGVGVVRCERMRRVMERERRCMVVVLFSFVSVELLRDVCRMQLCVSKSSFVCVCMWGRWSESYKLAKGLHKSHAALFISNDDTYTF